MSVYGVYDYDIDKMTMIGCGKLLLVIYAIIRELEVSTFSFLYFQNFSVEIQLESNAEFSHDHFKSQVDKAAGARYGTGFRDL